MIRNLGPLTMIVTIMVVLDAAWMPLLLAAQVMVPDLVAIYIMPIADRIDAFSGLFKILTMIVFARWIYVAGRNLVAAGYEDLEFTPASRIWWFAVPFANLVKPFQGMRELWNVSNGNEYYAEGSGLVATWWALWLLNGLTAYAVGFTSAAPEPNFIILWVGAGLEAAVAAIAITMIQRISNAQRTLSGPELAEVFA